MKLGKLLSTGVFLQAFIVLQRPALGVTDVEYTSQSQFLNALGAAAYTSNLNTITFEGLAPNSAPYDQGYSSVALQGVTFTPEKFSALVVMAPQEWPGYNFGTGDVLTSYGAATDTPVTATLPSGTYAVGLDVGDSLSDGTYYQQVNFALADGTSYVVEGGVSSNYGGSGFNFVGVISDTPISFVTFGPEHPQKNMTADAYDNFTFVVRANFDDVDGCCHGRHACSPSAIM